MPCYYCARERIATDDYGNCTHCQVAVCVSPSGRWDNAFHGEACVCGCGRLVCEMHLLEHAHGSHGRDDGAACFPSLWIAVGGGGIHGGAAVALEPERFAPEPWHEITRFLNVVRPGHRALRTLVQRLPGRAMEWNEEWGRPDEPEVIFAPEFFSRPVAETVAAHAADAVGTASEPLLERPGIPPGLLDLARAFHVSPEELRYACASLARWRKGTGPLKADALHPWLDDAPPQFATHLAQAIEMRRPRTSDPQAMVRELVMEAAAAPTRRREERAEATGERAAPGGTIEEVERPAEEELYLEDESQA